MGFDLNFFCAMYQRNITSIIHNERNTYTLTYPTVSLKHGRFSIIPMANNLALELSSQGFISNAAWVVDIDPQGSTQLT